MKKILSTFFVLTCFVFVLILPLLLGLHASMMKHHNMDVSTCIDHCLESEVYSQTPKIISYLSFVEIFITKVIFSKIFEYVLPLVFLYALLTRAPPNLYHGIRNYDYSSLTGVVKLTT